MSWDIPWQIRGFFKYKEKQTRAIAAIYILIQSESWQYYTINSYFDTHQNSHLENPLFVTKYRRLGHI